VRTAAIQRCTAGYTFSLPLRCDARALPTEKQIFGQLSFLRCSPGTLLLQCHAFDIATRRRPISAAKPPSCGLDVANPRVAAFSCTCIPRSLPGHDKSRWLPNLLSRLRVGNVAGDPQPPNSRPTSISTCPRVQTHAVDSGPPAAPRAVHWAKPYLQFLAHLASKCRDRHRPALGDGRVLA